ncbi:MAG: hypothetical protein M3O35_03165 [Acidobacteriota bacterium]|nr:hypothetical protein [Acidobacteriota bacterium]
MKQETKHAGPSSAWRERSRWLDVTTLLSAITGLIAFATSLTSMPFGHSLKEFVFERAPEIFVVAMIIAALIGLMLLVIRVTVYREKPRTKVLEQTLFAAFNNSLLASDFNPGGRSGLRSSD